MGIVFSLEDLDDALVDLGKKASEVIIDKALEKGSEPILKAMDKNVPIDTKELKGTLGEIKKEGSKTSRKVHLGSTSTDREIVERAYYQEYGHSSMNGKKWMKRSYNQSKDEAINIIGDYLADNLFKK